MKSIPLKILLTILLMTFPTLLVAHDVNYLSEAISNTSESIIEGRSGNSDEMLEYLENARDYAISAQAIQENKHIKIAIQHLNSAISHAKINDNSGATKDAGLAILHLKHVYK
jgi:hypothetical protein